MKPGSFDSFAEAFGPQEEALPAGWVRFHALRGLAEENEVVTFGFFDGRLEELGHSQEEGDYQTRRDAIEPYVEAMIANGVYEVVATWTAEGAPAS